MNNKSLLEKFKNLTSAKPSDRDLFKSKKADLLKEKQKKYESHDSKSSLKDEIAVNKNKSDSNSNIPQIEKQVTIDKKIQKEEKLNDIVNRPNISSIKNLIFKEEIPSSSLPDDFFDRKKVVKEIPEVQKEEIKTEKVSIEVKQQVEEQEESEQILIEDVEAMIECSNFISQLMKKDDLGRKKPTQRENNKFEYLMQEEESLNNLNYEENFKQKFLNRKRFLEAKENILKTEKEENTEDLFFLDWRNQD